MKIEIKELGPLKRTIYIYEDNIVRTPGFPSKAICRVKGDCIYEGGFGGKLLYKIKGKEIVEANKFFFPKTIYTFSDNAVFQNGKKIYDLVKVGIVPSEGSSHHSSDRTTIKIGFTVSRVENPQDEKVSAILKEYENGFSEKEYKEKGAALLKEGKNKEALISYLKALFISVNGVVTYNRLKQLGFPSDIVEESLICIGYGMTMPIKKLEEYYSVGMLDEVYNIGIPFISVEKPLFTQMVKEIIDGTYDDVDWEDKLTINFRKKLQGIR